MDQLQRPAREDFGISRIVLRRANGVRAVADALDAGCKVVLTRHPGLQISGVTALMAVGLLTLAGTLLR